jgi:hypothetical protein
MKKFIIKILIFILPIILSAYFIDLFISGSLKKSTSYGRNELPTWNFIMNKNASAEIVIYGSSRACLQVDPTMIEDSLGSSTYNLGINGHNFWLQYLRHNMLLQNNKKPKLIIHSIDVGTLEKRKDLFNLEQFLPYMLGNNEIKNATDSYLGFTWIDYKIPLVRYFGKPDAFASLIKLWLLPKSNVPQRIKGYESQNLEWNDDLDKAKKKIKFYNVQIDSSTKSLFEKYLQDCKEKKIKIVFIYTPEFIEGQEFVKNRNEVIALYTKYSKEYNIPFYDFSNDSLVFQRKYFYNSSHLNKTGVTIFTNELIDKLKDTNIIDWK